MNVGRLVVCCLFMVSVFTFECSAQDTTLNHTVAWYQKRVLKIAGVPTVLIAYGLSVKDHHGFYSSYDSYRDIQLNWPNFHTGIDNVTQFVPAISVYGLNLVGIKGQHNVLEATYLYSSSLLLATLVVQGLKHTLLEERPDGSSNTSFPSGHTASAFAAAEFLHHEYGHKSVWYSIAGYTLASCTGALRMLNDKHWQSDVLVGAGIGMFCTKMSYYVYPRLKKKARKPVLD